MFVLPLLNYTAAYLLNFYNNIECVPKELTGLYPKHFMTEIRGTQCNENKTLWKIFICSNIYFVNIGFDRIHCPFFLVPKFKSIRNYTVASNKSLPISVVFWTNCSCFTTWFHLFPFIAGFIHWNLTSVN